MRTEIEILDASISPPFKAHTGDAGIDLRSTANVTIQPHEIASIGLGVRVAVPEWCVGLLFVRSSVGRRGLTMAGAAGVIDPGYRGEVRAVLLNTGNEPKSVERGERIAQLVTVRFVPGAAIVRSLDCDTERGDGGFGSSGAF